MEQICEKDGSGAQRPWEKFRCRVRRRMQPFGFYSILASSGAEFKHTAFPTQFA